MEGFITRKTVIDNATLIIELYGVAVYEACLVAASGSTFLGVLIACGRI